MISYKKTKNIFFFTRNIFILYIINHFLTIMENTLIKIKTKNYKNRRKKY